MILSSQIVSASESEDSGTKFLSLLSHDFALLFSSNPSLSVSFHESLEFENNLKFLDSLDPLCFITGDLKIVKRQSLEKESNKLVNFTRRCSS